MTRRQKECLSKYNYAIKNEYKSIKFCYSRPSKTKLNIWNDIVMQCHELNGFGLTVVSYNVNIFTAAFKYKKDGKERLVYFAPSYTEDFEVMENEYAKLKKDEQQTEVKDD